jgi:hypothetical protein
VTFAQGEAMDLSFTKEQTGFIRDKIFYAGLMAELQTILVAPLNGRAKK